ncbi:glycoside hydrolase family 93 protein [Pseudocercospora fijiensis CIRAD86]|uniref:Glycoside hydrolase family 93 protein n=1 Tax=Pseudocercospora fijiensis (strain CIRAD86) TaxID=383855 RepID=M3A840_PSEFD|nr:glycoside hydrolase family 93 protein [Pseudocercospora fijiensis CIRAD86]EME80756.1 glycoside hydrolase family 93 protein [Pseudocercospora fijiensis CIRAD86]
MLLSIFILVLATFAEALSSPAPIGDDGPTDPLISNVTVFQPPANYTVPRTLYARTLQYHDGTLLATWENYGPNNNTFPYFPIYQSTDGGATWSERSRVEDTQNGWGLRYQPFLYELPEAIGDYPAGTVLLAGSSIPNDLSQTQIEIYASHDCGSTWEFVSHVAKGGRAIPKNGETPVWEPFLMVYNHELVVYYSDQRDPKHGQKLVHQTTSDLKNFGPVVDDVAYGTYDWRPGMTTVSHLPNGQYILTYEFYGAVEAKFAVYYRLSPDPLKFNDAVGHVITATDGTQPDGSPYNVWTPVGGNNGTIFVSAASNSTLFANRDLAAPGSDWIEIDTPEGASYTRSLLVEQQKNIILICGGGVINGKDNRVTASEIDISAI